MSPVHCGLSFGAPNFPPGGRSHPGPDPASFTAGDSGGREDDAVPDPDGALVDNLDGDPTSTGFDGACYLMSNCRGSVPPNTFTSSFHVPEGRPFVESLKM